MRRVEGVILAVSSPSPCQWSFNFTQSWIEDRETQLKHQCPQLNMSTHKWVIDTHVATLSRFSGKPIPNCWQVGLISPSYDCIVCWLNPHLGWNSIPQFLDNSGEKTTRCPSPTKDAPGKVYRVSPGRHFFNTMPNLGNKASKNTHSADET